MPEAPADGELVSTGRGAPLLADVPEVPANAQTPEELVAIAEALFNEYDYDGYFLEYDTERAGGFDPLRFVPSGKKFIVLGLITTKTGTLEDRGVIRARIEAAAKLVPLDLLCLSPQCGFASTEEGNLLSDEQQWAKLAEVVEIAADVWRA